MTDVSSEVAATRSPPSEPHTTHARARLRLGIAAVGTLVLLATLLLGTRAPAELLPTSEGWIATDPLWLALLVALYVAVAAPFDVLGGVVVPRRYGRTAVDGPYMSAWARGVAVHGGVLLAIATVLLAAARAGGDVAAFVAATLVTAVLVAVQLPLALLAGGVRREGGGDRLRSADRSFVGGVVGLPGRDRTLLSAGWDPATARVQTARREAVRRSGARTLGVVVAAAFDLGGLALVLLATDASATSVAGLAEISLWTTLWSFLGLLVLPTFSRPAVLAADQAAAKVVEPAELAAALGHLDADQEDESARGRLVETVFHPIPSLDRRLAALDAAAGPTLPRPWHTARTALFLSWATLGLLSRAVHCNCGRPALWVLFPGD